MKTLEDFLSEAKTLAQRSALEQVIHMIKQMPKEHQEKFQLALNIIGSAMENPDYTEHMKHAQEKAEHALDQITEVTDTPLSIEQKEEDFCKNLHTAVTKAFRYGTPEEVATVLINLVKFKAAKTACHIYKNI